MPASLTRTRRPTPLHRSGPEAFAQRSAPARWAAQPVVASQSAAPAASAGHTTVMRAAPSPRFSALRREGVRRGKQYDHHQRAHRRDEFPEHGGTPQIFQRTARPTAPARHCQGSTRSAPRTAERGRAGVRCPTMVAYGEVVPTPRAFGLSGNLQDRHADETPGPAVARSAVDGLRRRR